MTKISHQHSAESGWRRIYKTNEAPSKQAKQVIESPAAAAKNSAIISEKINQAMLERIKRIESELFKVEYGLNELPTDSSERKQLQKELTKLKKQAKDLTGKLPKNYDKKQRIKAVFDALHEEAKRLFLHEMEKIHFEADLIVDEMMRMEKDTKKAVGIVEKLRQVGYSDRDITSILLSHNLPEGMTGVANDMINYYIETKKMGIDLNVAMEIRTLNMSSEERVQLMSIWKETGMTLKQIQRLRVKENNMKSILEYIQRMKSSGLQKLLPVLDQIYGIESEPRKFLPSVLPKNIPAKSTYDKVVAYIDEKVFDEVERTPEKPMTIDDLRDLMLFSRKFEEQYGMSIYGKVREEERSSIPMIVKLLKSLPREKLDFVAHIYQHSSGVEYENLHLFLQDDTLPLSLEIYRKYGVRDIGRALKIGRSLYLDGVERITDIGMVKRKIIELEEGKNTLEKIMLFEGCNVALITNNEKYPNGTPRFETQALIEKLKKSAGPKGNVTVDSTWTDEPSADELRSLQKKIIGRIINTPPPMRLYFKGHGNSNGLYLTQGAYVSQESRKEGLDHISAQQMADAITARKDRWTDKNDKLPDDLYYFSSCFNHNYMRSVIRIIRENNGIQPILMGKSENGQFSFTNDKEEEKLLRLGERGIVVADIVKNEDILKESDLTVFAPSKVGKQQQVARNKEKNPKFEKNHT